MYLIYDIIIIGAGPAGLSLAHCSSQLNNKILIIDNEKTIGGCHRVKRIENDLFTEHGPRIYLSNYVNFFNLLSEIGIDKDKLFTKYKYSGYYIYNKFSYYELIIFTLEYIKFLFNNNHGYNINLLEFCNNKNISKSSIELLNKLCKYIDGSTIEKYSLNKILNSIDYSISDILQPIEPLDKGIFNKWELYLTNRNVDFLLGNELQNIHYNKSTENIDFIIYNNKIYYCKKLILAVPPTSLINILNKSNDIYIKNCFGDLNDLKEWTEKTEYIEYISITYHFKELIEIPKIHGMTFNTEWDIIVINLSDYMNNIEKDYKIVLSVAITNCDKKSIHINKTANECNKNELYIEVYRQLKKSIYPDLPDTYKALLNPNNYYYNKKWNTKDEAYFNTVNTGFIPFNSKTINNIYNVGTHNGHSYIKYTTLESAVSNGISLSLKLYPELINKYNLKKDLFLSNYIYNFIIIFIICILLYIIIRKITI